MLSLGANAHHYTLFYYFRLIHVKTHQETKNARGKELSSRHGITTWDMGTPGAAVIRAHKWLQSKCLSLP